MAKHLNRWTTRGLGLLVICGFLVALAAGELRHTLEWMSAIFAIGLVVVAAWKANQPGQSVRALLYETERDAPIKAN